MSVLLTTEVAGLTNPVLVRAEYTSNALADLYKADIIPIGTVFQSLGTGASDPTQTHPTLANADTIYNNVLNLLNLAQNGFVGTDGTTSYLTLDMAQGIDSVVKSLNTAGFFIAYANKASNPNDVINAMARWKDLADVGLTNLLQTSIDAINTNRTLQAMIELEYVKTGNDIIFGALSDLKTALGATQSVLDVMNNIQSLHNLVNLQSVNTFRVNDFTSGNPVTNIPLTGYESNNNQFSTIDQYSDQYKHYLDPTFNAPLGAVADQNPSTAPNPVDDPASGNPTNPGDPITTSTLATFNAMKGKLSQLIAQLDSINGQTPATRPAGSLAANLQNVLDDMNNANGGSGSDLQKFTAWVQDNYGSSTNQSMGNIQNRITQAITSATSLNDQQKDEVQSQMYAFEQFSKSAADMLSTISQMIVKMAQNISR